MYVECGTWAIDIPCGYRSTASVESLKQEHMREEACDDITSVRFNRYNSSAIRIALMHHSQK